MKKLNFSKWNGLLTALAFGFIYWPVNHGGCAFILHEPEMPEELKKELSKK